MAPLQDVDFEDDEPKLILFMCKSGRHRSVGGAELLYKFLNSDANPWKHHADHNDIELLHLSEAGWWHKLCQLEGDCSHCNGRNGLHQQAERVFTDRIKRLMRETIQRTPRATSSVVSLRPNAMTASSSSTAKDLSYHEPELAGGVPFFGKTVTDAEEVEDSPDS